MAKLGSDFQRWLKQVSKAPYRSSEAHRRYASLLARCADRTNDSRRSLAFEAAALCPHLALRLMLDDAFEVGPPQASAVGWQLAGSLPLSAYATVFLHEPITDVLERPLPTDAVLVVGKGATMEYLVEFASRCPNLLQYLERQAPFEQTRVPAHPDRNSRLVRLADSDADPLVALRRSVASLPGRLATQRLVADAVLPAMRDQGLALHFDIPDDTAYIFEPQGLTAWVIAPNLGTTLEDVLRSEDLAADERRNIIRALAALRQAMLDTGLIWEGFAPRNMFLSGRTIHLIDFERVCDMRRKPEEAATLLLWHRIWMADCLTPDETHYVFGSELLPRDLSPETELEADAFERALNGTPVTTWRDRLELLQSRIRIRGRHVRSSSDVDRGILFGNQLWHFGGDYFAPALEIQTFPFFRSAIAAGEATLTSCLEVFEVAMEADIQASMEDMATHKEPSGGSRTHRLLDMLKEASPEQLAAVRAERDDWYQELRIHPGRLFDAVECRLTSRVAGIDRDVLDRHFMGNAPTRAQHEAELRHALEAGCQFLYGDSRANKFLQYKSPDELREILAEVLPSQGIPFDDVLADFNSRVAPYSISQADRRYLALPDAGNAVSAMAGSLLSPLLNQNLIAVDRSAPAATFIEFQVIEWLRELVGFDVRDLPSITGMRDLAGLWTTGGHMSNHIAMLVALGVHFPEVRAAGLQSLSAAPSVIMSGPIAHYSHSEAAFHLGLGWDNVLLVGAAENYTTDAKAVDGLLRNPPAGKRPFMVIGVAGNCRTTGLDDLNALADVCQRYGVWFHVDACHGGSLLFSRRLKQSMLAGIERADSVAIDPHKGLFTPYPSSYVLFKDRGKLCQFSKHQAVVEATGCWDFGLVMPFFGSRGFESLRTWFMIKALGVETIGAVIEHRQALIRYLEKRIQESPLFVPFNQVDFYRLAFLFCPHDCLSLLADLPAEQQPVAVRILSHYTSRLNTLLYTSGLVCFDEHTLQDLGNRVGLGPHDKYTVMAACPGNPLLTETEIDDSLEILFEHARTLAEDLRSALVACEDSAETALVLGPAGWY